MKQYSWGIVGYKEDANEVGKELEKLGDELIPKSVVELAKNENSVLHGMFEWDNTIAGEKYRQQQASRIICNLRVNIIEEEKEKPRKVRAFVTTRKNTTFEPIEKVVKDTDRYALLLEKAYKELNGIKVKYDELVEIQELLKNIPEID